MQTAPYNSRANERLLSANAVKVITGRGHTWLYAAIKDGRLPKPRKIGKRNVWLETEILSWMANLPAAN